MDIFKWWIEVTRFVLSFLVDACSCMLSCSVLSDFSWLCGVYLCLAQSKQCSALSSWGRHKVFPYSFGLVYAFQNLGNIHTHQQIHFSPAQVHKRMDCINPLVSVFLSCWVRNCDSFWFQGMVLIHWFLHSVNQQTNMACLVGCETLHHSLQGMDGAADRMGALHFAQLEEGDNKQVI